MAVHRPRVIALPSIYLRPQARGGGTPGLLVPVTELTPPSDGETVETATVRFRTVGDITCTCRWRARRHAAEIVIETLASRGERARRHRMDDKTSAKPPWKNAKDGYF